MKFILHLSGKGLSSPAKQMDCCIHADPLYTKIIVMPDNIVMQPGAAMVIIGGITLHMYPDQVITMYSWTLPTAIL